MKISSCINNKGYRNLYALALIFLLFWPPVFVFANNTIIQKPIIFDKQRIALTRDYQREHYGIQSSSITIEPKFIVLHWTKTATLADAFAVFNPVKLSRDRMELPGALNVSAHYLVDRDGMIYQLMPDNWMARHVIGLNHYAIGIENVGGVHGVADLTSAQVQANAYLVKYLRRKYLGIRYVIGHYEYLKFKDTPWWLEKRKEYQTIKSDPGLVFMRQIRKIIN